MIHDPSAEPWHSSLRSPGSKRRFSFRRKPADTNKVGLLPKEGWRQRNLQFLGEVLIPHLLTPRQPGWNAEAVPNADTEEIAVTWLGHAGFFVQVGAMNIAIDPNWALWLGPVKRVRHPSLRARDIPRVDLVLITHAHFDHLHLPSLRAIAKDQPIVLPKGCGSLVKRCGFSRIVELDTWQSTRYRDVKITLTPARHWGARMIHDTYRKFGGYLIEGGGRALYHCGDSAMFDGFAEIGGRSQIDVALMPIGAYTNPSCRPVHINPEEAIDAFEMLHAGIMVPMHFDTFPLSGEPLHEPSERFVAEARKRKLGSRMRLMQEGESAVF